MATVNSSAFIVVGTHRCRHHCS